MRVRIFRLRAVFIACGMVVAMTGFTSPAQPSPFGQGYDAAFEAMYDDPTNLDSIFQHAATARRVGDYEGAIGALERMLVFNPNLSVVRYELTQSHPRRSTG